MTGIPIYNVNNNCSTGSTGLFMARQFCASGIANVVLVVGFEKMFAGSLQTFFKDRVNPLDKSFKLMDATRGFDPKTSGAAQLFGNAGREYMEKDRQSSYRIGKTHAGQTWSRRMRSTQRPGPRRRS